MFAVQCFVCARCARNSIVIVCFANIPFCYIPASHSTLNNPKQLMCFFRPQIRHENKGKNIPFVIWPDLYRCFLSIMRRILKQLCLNRCGFMCTSDPKSRSYWMGRTIKTTYSHFVSNVSLYHFCSPIITSSSKIAALIGWEI